MISAAELITNLQDETQFRIALCRYYPRGECSRGSSCKFIHEITGDLELLQDAAGLVPTNVLQFALDPDLNRPHRQLFASTPRSRSRSSASLPRSAVSRSSGSAMSLLEPDSAIAGLSLLLQQVLRSTTSTADQALQVVADTEHDAMIAATLQTALDEVSRRDRRDDSRRQRRTMCVICLESPTTCGLLHGTSIHVCCCEPCAQQVTQTLGQCPICRRRIERVVQQICFAGPEEEWECEADAAITSTQLPHETLD